VQGGGGAAHRYAKPLEAVRVASAADDCGTPSACPAVLLQADYRKWVEVWGASPTSPSGRHSENPGPSPILDGDLEVQRWLGVQPQGQMPPLTVEEVRAAALRFKLRTCTPDGWHPRHIALLPHALLAALVQLYHAAEATGDFAEGTRLVVVPLITAKRRPIGLYSALVRVWAAARKQLVYRWSRRLAHPAFGTDRGCAAADSVWRGAVRACEARSRGQHAAHVHRHGPVPVPVPVRGPRSRRCR
jgi:hypothetical protein